MSDKDEIKLRSIPVIGSLLTLLMAIGCWIAKEVWSDVGDLKKQASEIQSDVAVAAEAKRGLDEKVAKNERHLEKLDEAQSKTVEMFTEIMRYLKPGVAQK